MMSPIGHKIMAWPATTFAGLAIKARVVQDACGHYWDESYRDCDWDRQMVRSLIQAVLAAGAATALAGIGGVSLRRM
jgi:hypothetical protein